jgi:hypothetical protein
MPYIFPKRRLRDEDVLDPVELNGDFTPAAELYSGNLDRHNLKSNISLKPKSDNANAKSGYFNHYYVEVEADPDFGASPSYNAPTSDDTDAYEIPANLSWTVVDRMVLNNIKTGVSVLWINAWAQYIWLGFESYQNKSLGKDTSTNGQANLYLTSTMNFYSRNSTLPCALQFALKVDGSVIESTITGHANRNERITQPWSWLATRKNVQSSAYDSDGIPTSSGLPGPVTDYDTGVSGNGPEIMPIRVGGYIPVSPGTHSVELVVRRLTDPDTTKTYFAPIVETNQTTGTPSSDSTTYATAPALNLRESDTILIYNRKLQVMDMPVLAPATTTFDSVEVTTLDTEDTISAASLGTNAIDKVRDKLNDVQEGALARGALTNVHLRSPLVASSSGSINPGSAQDLKVMYPAYGDSTVLSNPVANNVGWFGLTDGAGTGLRTGALNNVQSKDAGYLIILANVQINRVDIQDDTFVDDDGDGTTDTLPPRNDTSLTGALALGYKTGGVVTIIDSTRCFVNNYNTVVTGTLKASSGTRIPALHATFAVTEQFDVALMHVIDLTSPASHAIDDYDYFQVYGSIISTDNNRTMRWQRGDISYIYLRA